MKTTIAASTLALFLSVAASRAADPITVDLWPGGKPPGQTVEPGPDTVTGKGGKVRISNVTRPQIKIYPAAKEKNTGTALIIAPGGGFKDLGWSFEGETMAEWCSKLGVTGVILKYRVPGNGKGNPDGQRAVSLLRSRGAEWGINPNQIGMIGFSAGGGVTSHVLLNTDKRSYESTDEIDKASTRLNFAVLIYSVGSLGGKDGANLDKAKMPPIFLCAAYDDGIANGSIQTFANLKKAGIPAEIHIYATGGHGFGYNLMNPPVPLVGDWSHRLEAWMRYLKLLDLKKAP